MAGVEGIGNHVSGVNVMEVPDIINWVKPGELLITAGYSYRKKPEEFANLIPELAQKGVACLGIKAYRYFNGIPKVIVEKADQCDLPVIELNEGVIFSDVVRETIERLTESEYKTVSGMLAKITELSELILGTGGLRAVLQKLSEYIGNPVIIITESGQVISTEQDYLDVQQDSGDYLICSERQGYTKLSVDGYEKKAFFCNVAPQGEQLARLYVVCKNRGISNTDISLVEKTLFLIGMELLGEGIRQRVEAKYIDQMLQSWVLGKIESAESFKMQASASRVNIRPGCNYIVILVNHTQNVNEEQLHLLIQRFRKNLLTHGDFFVTDIENRIAFIIPEAKRREYSQVALELCEMIFGSDAGVHLCVGKGCTKYYNLSDSYYDALNISRVSKRYKLNGKILEYKDTGAYSILYQIPVGKELDDYLSLYIKPLINYDNEHQTNMYETLKMYLDTKGNTKVTAEKMFVHYNTISYRLERISNILGLPIEDGEIQFCLNLAIKIYDMYL